MDKEDFKKYGYMFIDWIADYFDELEKYPVSARTRPGEVKRNLQDKGPDHGEAMDVIFKDFQDIILPGITHWQHPSWFAYFPANNSQPSILAELLTAGIGAQCMSWQTSPAATELEEVVMEWLRKMLGLPEGMEGVIQDTASTASLVALLSARERATNFVSNQKGMTNDLVVYMSEEAHSSIEKGAKIAGYGKENVRTIPTAMNYAMIPPQLENAIIRDKERGLKPACVVATVGTTSSGALDPVLLIGKICKYYNVWLHVDAAYGGLAAILPDKKQILNGIEYADSFVFNPHKWMLTNFDCSAYFVKDKNALLKTFEIHPEYLKTQMDAMVKNYRDWGIQLGRRFRALKLWFVLRYYGVEGLRRMVKEHIRLAQLFKSFVEGHEKFELMAPVDLSLVCFRLNDGRPEETMNLINKKFLDRINQTGKLFLTSTNLKGKYVLRFVVGSRTTEEVHVRAAWEIIMKTGEDILSKM